MILHLKYLAFRKLICYRKLNFVMLQFSQLFNDKCQSAMYESRPEYSEDIVSQIITYWKKFNIDTRIEKNLNIVDVGCGTGQLTNKLIPYAKSLIGIDTSESQINQARTHEITKDFPKFLVASCYDIPVLDNSIDLITAAQCVHWFDMDKFYTEVDRCLKPNGVLTIISYGKGYFVVNDDQNMISQLNKFVAKDYWFDEKYLGLYCSEKPKWAWNLLPGLKPLYPINGIRNDKLNMTFKLSLKRYRDYLLSASMYQTWKKCNPHAKDLVEIAMEKIMFYLGNPPAGLDTELLINFPLCIIMCSKPS